MAIQFVGSAIAGKAGVASGGANSSLSLASGLTGGIRDHVDPGDFVVGVFGAGTTSSATLAIMDGSAVAYSQIDALRRANATYDAALRVAYKFMGGTVDPSIVFGPTGDAAWAGVTAVAVWSGVDPSNPLDVAAVAALSASENIIRPNPDPITPATPGAIIAIAGVGADDAITSAFTASQLTGGFVSTNQADTVDCVAGIGHVAWDGAGAFDCSRWSGASTTDATGGSWVSIAFALRPAPEPVNTNANLPALNVSAPAATVAISGGGSGTFPAFAISALAATVAIGAAATGALPSVTVSKPQAAVVGKASAAGELPTVLVSELNGTAGAVTLTETVLPNFDVSPPAASIQTSSYLSVAPPAMVVTAPVPTVSFGTSFGAGLPTFTATPPGASVSITAFATAALPGVNFSVVQALAGPPIVTPIERKLTLFPARMDSRNLAFGEARFAGRMLDLPE